MNMNYATTLRKDKESKISSYKITLSPKYAQNKIWADMTSFSLFQNTPLNSFNFVFKLPLPKNDFAILLLPIWLLLL